MEEDIFEKHLDELIERAEDCDVGNGKLADALLDLKRYVLSFYHIPKFHETSAGFNTTEEA